MQVRARETGGVHYIRGHCNGTDQGANEIRTGFRRAVRELARNLDTS